MAKSRSRSPRWKSRPPPYRSPEHNRHRHFQEHYQDGEGFHRDSRRPIHWEEERHGQSNSRMAPYKRFNDKNYEPDSFSADFRKSPFDSSSQLKRMHSPDRRGDGNRRFPTNYPEDHNRPRQREHRDYHQRNHELNAHNETNGFKPARREETFHRSYHREPPDRDWQDGHWNQDHTDPSLPPPNRRSQEFFDQNSFPKRHIEDRDYREPLPKRARVPDRHDYRPAARHSHWNDDRSSRPYHEKNWSKDTDLRDSSSDVHPTHSGKHNKIQYDYSHRSPSYVHAELEFSNDRYEDKKNFTTKTFQHNRSNISNRERGQCSETKSPEPSTKYNERKAPNRDVFKLDNKHPNHKHKESGTKAEYRREPSSKRHLDNHTPKSPDPTIIPKINSEKESIMANLDVKKSVDKYRQPHEHWNISKDIQPKSDIPQGQRNHEQKRSEKNVQKRNNSTSNERQMSEDLVAVGGKDAFHPVFDHLSSSKQRETNAPSTEFTQEIITIIHEVKANHFKSPEMSLHERFSKLQGESNKEELNLKKPPAQPNPEIHRRIDISLEDLQNKTLHKTEVTLASQRVIEDPNDLRHDIERRRKQRLHSEEDGSANLGFCDSDVSGSYYKPHNNDTGEFTKMSRENRAPFRKSAGRPPGSSYRGNTHQFFSSRSHFEHSDEGRKPYKGWRNPATSM